MRSNCDIKICVVGLGYVGLPLALLFSKLYDVIGFDIDDARVEQLSRGDDITGEQDFSFVNKEKLKFTSSNSDIGAANFYVITVPTPVDADKRPDLTFIKAASELVGANLSPGDYVVYESTVYPGCTEEICVPILERSSSLRLNHDFFVGYSPERINPGDSERAISDIVKVTSGSCDAAAVHINDIYASVISAGTYLAANIKVAEAAKVIENTQRDLNIALMNELSIIFNYLDIDTHSVLAAAETKWNFHPYSPGLVGGHCISVDPYYLTSKAISVGYIPDVILAGRRLNDGMPKYVVDMTFKEMVKRNIDISNSSVLVLGVTFKEDCADTRNSKAFEVATLLSDLCGSVDVYDPFLEGLQPAGCRLVQDLKNAQYDAVILAVPHKQIVSQGVVRIRELLRGNGLIFDLKAALPKGDTDLRL